MLFTCSWFPGFPSLDFQLLSVSGTSLSRLCILEKPNRPMQAQLSRLLILSPRHFRCLPALSRRLKSHSPIPPLPRVGKAAGGVCGDRGGCEQLLVAMCPYFLELDFGPEKTVLVH